MIVGNNSQVASINILFEDIHRYYIPILVHLGLLGNCISVCVFFGTKLRYISSSIYLAALAISDTGFLVVNFMSWLSMVHINVFHQPGLCQFFTYLSYLCNFLSVWFVVAFTVERYVAVKWPLRRKFLCTVARAKVVIIGLTVLAVPLCSPVLLFSKSIKKVNERYCVLNKNWALWATAYNAFDTVITFAIPLTMIVIFNTLIARNIYQQNNIRRTLTMESDTSNENAQTRNRMPQIKVTKMLLLISSVFFCFNMPAFVFRLIAFLYNDYEPVWLIWTQKMAYLLFSTNFGINFILYCACGENFRRAMIDMFMRRSDTRRSGTIMQMENHEKHCEFMRKCSSTKRSHFVDEAQQENPQEMQKLSINEE